MEKRPAAPSEGWLGPDEYWAAAGLRRGEMGFEPPRGVTRIEARPGLDHFVLPTPGPPKDLARVFRPLTDAGVSVDLVKLHENGLHFALSSSEAPRAQQVLAGLGYQLQPTPNCAIITVYAPDMRSIPGIMGRIVSALQHAGVAILETDDSYNCVFCLIECDQTRAACAALASEFGLEAEATEGPIVEW